MPGWEGPQGWPGPAFLADIPCAVASSSASWRETFVSRTLQRLNSLGGHFQLFEQKGKYSYFKLKVRKECFRNLFFLRDLQWVEQTLLSRADG